MRRRTITTEQGAFVLAFLLALFIRLVLLGRNPLSDAEAGLALQALELARGGSPLLGGQPGYVLFTAVVFFIGGASEVTARLLPAVVGSLVIWAPYLFQWRLGRIPAVMLAFLFAIEPGLVAVSRQADGFVFAVAFGLLAAGFLYRRQPVPGGFFAGLALLSGPSVWTGLLIAGIAVLWTALFDSPSKHAEYAETDEIHPAGWPWRAALPWMAGTLVVLGTLFLWAPSGLNALFSSFTEFISGWGQTAAVPVGRMLLGLALYAPLALLMGGIGIVWSFFTRDPTDTFLARWFLVALLIGLIYPGRQVPDLVWALLPLWAIAARQLTRQIQLIHSDWAAFTGQAALVFVLVIFAWMNFVYLSNQAVDNQASQLRWLTIAGSILLMLVVAILVAWGWSSQSAAGGLLWGLTAVLLIFTFSSAWNAAGLGRRPDAELWRRSPHVSQADLLLLTATNMAQWNTPARDALDLFVVDVPSPSLHWALRNYRRAQVVNVLPPGSNPAMVITQEQEEPALAASYTGQGLVWQRSPIWDGVNWMRWAIVRAAPVRDAKIILWVRSDLHPGAGQEAAASPETSGE